MHIKAKLGRVVLATKMATGSLTKTINRVDNGRGLQRSRVEAAGKMIHGLEVEVFIML